MAASAWTVYNKAIKKIGNGTIVLGAATRIALVKGTSNFATSTMSLWGSVTNQVASGNGYSTSGKALASEAWTAGTSAGQYKFDATDPIWTASGGAISSIKAAVLFMSGASAGVCHLLAFAALTSTSVGFNLSDGNTLTLTFNSAGIFTVANA